MNYAERSSSRFRQRGRATPASGSAACGFEQLGETLGLGQDPTEEVPFGVGERGGELVDVDGGGPSDELGPGEDEPARGAMLRS